MSSKNTQSAVKSFAWKDEIKLEDISLYTDTLRVELPPTKHDPLVAAVALFNVKYFGETIRVWYSGPNITNYIAVLQWDLGKLAYKLLTFDESGTREFDHFDIDSLLQLSMFRAPVETVFCNVNEWSDEGRKKLEELIKEHPPKNFRVKPEPDTGRNVMVYTFHDCSTTGRVTRTKRSTDT